MLEGFLKEIKNEIKKLNFAQIYKGHLSIGNITESGYKGVLTKIQIQDSGIASVYNATISINIDGAGAVVLDLNTMYKSLGTMWDVADTGTNTPAAVAVNLGGKTQFVSSMLGSGGGATIQSAMTLELNIPFQTSLAVTIANDDGHCIFWNEEV